eukprot:1527411-Prymnesium_polylepis.1
MRGEERGGERPTRARGHAVGHVESRANWSARTSPTFAHGLRTIAMLLARCAPRVVRHACEV